MKQSTTDATPKRKEWYEDYNWRLKIHPITRRRSFTVDVPNSYAERKSHTFKEGQKLTREDIDELANIIPSCLDSLNKVHENNKVRQKS